MGDNMKKLLETFLWFLEAFYFFTNPYAYMIYFLYS